MESQLMDNNMLLTKLVEENTEINGWHVHCCFWYKLLFIYKSDAADFSPLQVRKFNDAIKATENVLPYGTRIWASSCARETIP